MFNCSKYTNWYYSIIDNAKNNKKRSRDDVCVYEEHHIIPSSLGGGNDRDNLVLLTLKEHFICHWLLSKMCISKSDAEKMLHALHFNMNVNNVLDKTSRTYINLRTRWIENHQAKNPECREKISKSLIEYNKSRKETDEYKKWLENRIIRCYTCEEFTMNPKFCSLECYHKSMEGVTKNDKEHSAKLSKSLKKYLTTLSKEEKSKRTEKARKSPNRGAAISKGKKNKKTNQKMITILKYASMSEKEFDDFLFDKKEFVKKRMLKYRNEGMNIKNVDGNNS